MRLIIEYDCQSELQKFAIHEMKMVFEKLDYTVCIGDSWADVNAVGDAATHMGSDALARVRIVLTTRSSAPTTRLGSPTPTRGLQHGPQSYSVRRVVLSECVEWHIVGWDECGAMYGGLDFARRAATISFEAMGEWDSLPYIAERGIKFNIPLDARTPSYSDSGDSAQANIADVWDKGFWRSFLDGMARARLNVLSLWNLHPFPSMVKVPAYPEVALDDVKRTTIPLMADLLGRGMSTPESLRHLETLRVMSMDEKMQFWREVMEHAHARGVDVYVFTWNTFIYGTEGSGYCFTTDLSDSATKDYFRKSVEALVNTYPLLKGIGITAGENMSRDADVDETWLFDTYGQGINDALAKDSDREFCLIHRVQFANIYKARGAFAKLDPRCRLDTSFKYSQAHMHSAAKPQYIHACDGSYLRDIGDNKTWLTVRDDDYYMFRGGTDTEFVREYIKGMPYDKLQGFYIGADGYTWGREYLSCDAVEVDLPDGVDGVDGVDRVDRVDALPQLVIEKRWFFLTMWGSLAYCPELPDSYFVGLLKLRFPGVDAHKLFHSWAMASRVIPLVNRFHNEGCQLDFQWYPEGCTSNTGFHDIDRFIKTAPQHGEGIIGIPEYADAVLSGRDITGMTPLDVSRVLWEVSEKALELVDGMYGYDDEELRQTLCDIKSLATLGKYYSLKISGATNRHLADRQTSAVDKSEYTRVAVSQLGEGSAIWQRYVALVSSAYKPQVLTRMIPDPTKNPGLPRQTDIALLQEAVDFDVVLASQDFTGG